MKFTDSYILDYEVKGVPGINSAVTHEYDMRTIVFEGGIVILPGICIRCESPLAVEVNGTRLQAICLPHDHVAISHGLAEPY